jgi:uncharacterized membrane protein (UPF0127 family)
MLINRTSGQTIVRHVVLATTFLQRLNGLMFSRTLDPDSAWVFPSCNSVHMFFMRYPLGLVFLDKEQRVVTVIPSIAPGRVSPWVRKACTVIEMRPEKVEGINVGDVLEIM